MGSVGLRPFVVYGPGRDQGMTSTPTVAILAAVAGVPYRISFGGPVLFNFAADAATAFVNASRLSCEGAHLFNIPGTPAAIPELIAAVDAVVPGAADILTHSDDVLPAPSVVDDRNTELLFGTAGVTRLVDGVAQTVEVFRAGLRSGLLEPPPSAAAVAR